MSETQRQLALLRSALEGLGEATLFTRTREGDLHFYRALGALAVLEQEAGGELAPEPMSPELMKQFAGLGGMCSAIPLGGGKEMVFFHPTKKVSGS